MAGAGMDWQEVGEVAGSIHVNSPVLFLFSFFVSSLFHFSFFHVSHFHGSYFIFQISKTPSGMNSLDCLRKMPDKTEGVYSNPGIV
jgi:hypothetical protein